MAELSEGIASAAPAKAMLARTGKRIFVRVIWNACLVVGAVLAMVNFDGRNHDFPCDEFPSLYSTQHVFMDTRSWFTNFGVEVGREAMPAPKQRDIVRLTAQITGLILHCIYPGVSGVGLIPILRTSGTKTATSVLNRLSQE